MARRPIEDMKQFAHENGFKIASASNFLSNPLKTLKDTGGDKRHVQRRRESVCGIARFCVRIVGHCHVVRRTERDRRARIVYRKLIIQFRSNSMPELTPVIRLYDRCQDTAAQLRF